MIDDLIKLKDYEILQVRGDTLFHDLFNENDIDTIEWIVTQILECNHEEIKDKVRVVTSKLTRIYNYEKNKTVDLMVEYQNRNIIIELNNHQLNYTRNVCYAFNVLFNSFNKANYYADISHVILVNLNWNIPKKNKVLGKELQVLNYPSYIANDYMLKIININLAHYEKLCYDKLEKFDKLYKLLTAKNQEELENLVSNEKLLERYKKQIIKLSNKEEYRETYMNELMEENMLKLDAYLQGKMEGQIDGFQEGMEEGRQEGIAQGMAQGMAQGIEQGIEEGIRSNQRKMIINMYKQDLELEIIANSSNLSIEEVKDIINNC